VTTATLVATDTPVAAQTFRTGGPTPFCYTVWPCDDQSPYERSQLDAET
jgi:hypothetical protein